MNRQLLVLSAVCLLIVASCKKSNDDKEETNCQLTELVSGDDGGIYRTLYTYDDKGRITKMKYADDNYEENYTYSSTQITEVINDGNDVITTVFKLDGSGKIISSITTYPNDLVMHNHTDQYIYDNQGHLIEWKKTSSSEVISSKYTYANGNLTTIKSGSSTKTLEYGNEEIKDNFYWDGLSPDFSTNVLKKYYGKVSKNLVNKIITPAWSTILEYQKDNKGEIIKITETNEDGSKSIENLKYACN